MTTWEGVKTFVLVPVPVAALAATAATATFGLAVGLIVLFLCVVAVLTYFWR